MAEVELLQVRETKDFGRKGRQLYKQNGSVTVHSMYVF